MKLLKRSLALLLSLILCLGFVTFSAFAEGPDDADAPASTEQNYAAQSSSEAEEPETDAVETADGSENSTPADNASQVVDSKSDDPSEEYIPSDTQITESQNETTEADAPAEDEEPIVPESSTGDSTEPSNENSGDEPPVEEEQPEPLTISVAKLKDVQIKNGVAEFVVEASCNQEDALITFQWQKLDTKGAFSEIEDQNERALAREAAWEDLDGETAEKLCFKDIENFTDYEDLLFRCRVTAGDAVVYSDEVKLLPEIVSDEQTPETEPGEAADEPFEGESAETDPTEEVPGEEVSTDATEEPSEDEPQEPEEEEPVSEEEAEEEGPTEEGETEEEVEAAEVILLEDYVWEGDLAVEEGDLTVEEGAVIHVSGAAIVPEGVTLTVAGILVIEEEASLTVAGKLVLAETAALEGDPLAITAAETAEIEGLDRFLPEKEEETPSLDWNEILSAGVFAGEEAVLMTEDVTIPVDGMLVIHSGELIIAPEATLTVEGLLIVDGGTLTISEGATLKNDMFIQMEGGGMLLVEGVYEQAEAAAIVWDAANSDSSVEGISRSFIDKTILVADAEALNAALSRDGYRTLTVLLTNAELAKALDRVPNGVIISVR